MIVARWSVEAKYGHKQEAVALLKAWNEEFGSQLGWSDSSRMLTGSLGGKEAEIVSEITLNSLSELDEAFQKIAEMKGHSDWSKKIGEHVVSGSNRWTVYRVL